jgi:hypothetical protein
LVTPNTKAEAKASTQVAREGSEVMANVTYEV